MHSFWLQIKNVPEYTYTEHTQISPTVVLEKMHLCMGEKRIDIGFRFKEQIPGCSHAILAAQTKISLVAP